MSDPTLDYLLKLIYNEPLKSVDYYLRTTAKARGEKKSSLRRYFDPTGEWRHWLFHDEGGSPNDERNGIHHTEQSARLLGRCKRTKIKLTAEGELLAKSA